MIPMVAFYIFGAGAICGYLVAIIVRKPKRDKRRRFVK
jgi:hypothetical protein